MSTRRSFLKQSALSAGSLAIMPYFSNIFAAENNNKLPHRFIFIRKSNGNIPKQFSLPTFSTKEKKMDDKKEAFTVDLDKHELPLFMRVLDPYKEHLSVFHGISQGMCPVGHFSGSCIMGLYKSDSTSANIKRASIDFELAKLYPSPYGHVELALRGNYSFKKGILSGYSAPGPQQRNYCYADPETAYNELFKSVTNPGLVDSDNAMLEFLKDEENLKAKNLKGTQRYKFNTHLSSITAVKKRNVKIQKMSKSISHLLPKLDKIHLGGGDNATTPEKQSAMTDILIASLKAGLTNVVTYTIDELGTPIVGLKGNEGDNISIHDVGHYGGYSGVSAEEIREKIKTGHATQIAKIVKELKATPEGNGTMFDNTTIIYMPEAGADHHGPETEMPMITLTGKNSKLDMAGRYIRLPFHGTTGHRTVGNWYTTLLNLHGNPIKHYGDLDQKMSRLKLPQLGSIKELMA
jgi:hypothetical protein